MRNIFKDIDKELKNKYFDRKERCFVQEYFEGQAKLPPSMRQSSVYISCPCKRCNPYSL